MSNSLQMHTFPQLRQARRLTVHRAGTSLMAYDLDTDAVHHLEGVAAQVWTACEGAGSWTELAAWSRCSEAEAASAVEQLVAAGLVDVPQSSRRAFLARSAAVGGAAIVGGPLITSILSPAAAATISATLSNPQDVLTDPPDLPVTPPVLTTVYDPYVDFNANRTQNPTHSWNWARKAAPFGNSVTQYPGNHVTDGYSYWAQSRFADMLAPPTSWVGINPSLYEGKLLMFPSQSAESALATFIVPTDGSYSGTMTFRYENPSGSTATFGPTGQPLLGAAPGEDGVLVYVFKGDTTPQLPGTSLNASNRTVSITISGSADLGVKYNFVVYATSSNRNVNDLVSLSGQISVAN